MVTPKPATSGSNPPGIVIPTSAAPAMMCPIRCWQTSVRQGCTETTLVYRRDMKDMPAADEVHEMLEEGARAIFQASPTRVVTNDDNVVTGVEFQRMALGEPDASGRRRPQALLHVTLFQEVSGAVGVIGPDPGQAIRL